MKILVACEESQRVADEFRLLGHEAYSCDILATSGNHPEYHIQQDVLPLLNHNVEFYTSDGLYHFITKWDMIIAFPPCTYLTKAGNRWFNVDRYGQSALLRYKSRQSAIEFFYKFVNAECDHIAIENPVGIMSSVYRRPDQIIQPYYFGDNQRKSTCLWLKNLPLLIYTNIVSYSVHKRANGRKDSSWIYDTVSLDSEYRSRIRSKTYPGIAKAMAEQWSNNYPIQCKLFG